MKIEVEIFMNKLASHFIKNELNTFEADITRRTSKNLIINEQYMGWKLQ